MFIPRLAAAAVACPIEPFIEPPEGLSQATMTADSASLNEQGMANAAGMVRMEKLDQALEAPSLTYDRTTSRVVAPDGLKYYRPGLNVSAEYADVNVNDSAGVFNQARFTLPGNGARGAAEKVEILDPDNFTLDQADYSTCPGEDKAWRLGAERIELNRAEGWGEAHDATLRLFDVPVLYTPYLNFPIDDRRKSGLLLPVAGTSGSSGFDLAVPYYLNLAPNYDATLIPRILTDRGFQLGGQLRYLSEHHTGELAGEYLPSDSVYGEERALIQAEHQGRFSERFGVEALYSKASDDDYFDDLGSNLAQTSQAQLERRLEFDYVRDWLHAEVLAQTFQALEPDDENQVFRLRPYGQLPTARLALKTPTFPWQARLDIEAANFRREDSLEGERYHLRPSFNWLHDRQSWYVEAETAWDYTEYRLNNSPLTNVEDNQDRSLPMASLKAGMRFERLFAGGLLQTLEPRLFYLYRDFEFQGNLPLFDTGTPDLHFERLFANNRFVGLDRLGDANQMTVALTSRILDPATGRAILKADIGRVIGFDELEVNLPQRSAFGYEDKHSDYVANLELAPTSRLFAGLTVQYEPDAGQLNRGTARTGYRDEQGRRIDLGYSFYRNFRPLDPFNPLSDFETLEQTDIIVFTPITDRVRAFGRWNYSLDKHQSVESLGGFEYRPSCCWAFRGALRRFVRNSEGDYDTAIIFQIELTGLGRFGEDIESLLGRGIDRDEEIF